MNLTIAVIGQILIALGIFNVWIVRRNRPTPYRPDGADGIEEEFRRYGLPSWMWRVVGVTKVSLALMLLVGIAFPAVVPFAAGAMAVLMVSAIGAHIRVADPLVKAIPALTMLMLCVAVLATHST